MVGIARLRRIARRRKRTLFAAALCSASFLAGHGLFGEDEPPASPPTTASLLSEYLAAKNDLVTAPADNQAAADSPNTTSPAGRRLKPVVIAPEAPAEPAPKPSPAEPMEIRPLTTEAAPAGSLRPAAVSAAADLPFIPAQPLPRSASLVPAQPLPAPSEAQPAVAHVVPSTRSAVAQASIAVFAAKTPAEDPRLKTPAAAPSLARPTDDENLPPIVPAWAVPRPGTKKKPPVAPVNAPAPSKAAEQSAVVSPASQNLPPPLRIELGGSSPPSPATLPPAAPPPPAQPKRAENSPPHFPQVIETPRASGLPPAATAQSSAEREPSLLPPSNAAQPMPLQIRNPHVSQASQASFEMPLAWPATSRQNLDNTGAAR